MEKIVSQLNIRRGVLSDSEQFVAIKNALPMPEVSTADHGGFILGTNSATYRYYIEHSICYVAEKDRVVGFAIILPDSLVRESDIWKKRAEADFLISLSDIEHRPICYFEQLAFLPEYRFAAARTAFAAAKEAFAVHDFMFMTTVNKPVENKAALRFIRTVGGIPIGQINELYPKVGHIVSDIHLIESRVFFERTNSMNIR